MSSIDAVASAISLQEGFNVAGSRAARNNNPGNLRDAAGSIWPDLPHDSGGFVVFPSIAAGWNALTHDLTLKASRGMTLGQTIAAWAPLSDGNDTAGYLSFVASKTGLAPSDSLLADSAGNTAGAVPDSTDAGVVSFDAAAFADSGPGVWLLGLGAAAAALLIYRLIR